MATEQDRGKLLRVMSFLNVNRDMPLVIKQDSAMLVESYVDVSFCNHLIDENGYTALVVCDGGVSVLWQSSK